MGSVYILSLFTVLKILWTGVSLNTQNDASIFILLDANLTFDALKSIEMSLHPGEKTAYLDFSMLSAGCGHLCGVCVSYDQIICTERSALSHRKSKGGHCQDGQRSK